MIKTIEEYKEIQQAETMEQYKLLQHIEKNFCPETFEYMKITLLNDNTIKCEDITDVMMLQLCGDLVFEIDGDDKILRGIV